MKAGNIVFGIVAVFVISLAIILATESRHTHHKPCDYTVTPNGYSVYVYLANGEKLSWMTPNRPVTNGGGTRFWTRIVEQPWDKVVALDTEIIIPPGATVVIQERFSIGKYD